MSDRQLQKTDLAYQGKMLKSKCIYFTLIDLIWALPDSRRTRPLGRARNF
jgi:hypothetical protein